MLVGLAYNPSGGAGPYVAQLTITNTDALRYGYSLKVRSRTREGECPIDPETWQIRAMWYDQINTPPYSFTNTVDVEVGSCHGAAVELFYNDVAVPGSIVTAFIDNI